MKVGVTGDRSQDAPQCCGGWVPCAGESPHGLLAPSLSPSPVEWCRLGSGELLFCHCPAKPPPTQPQEEGARLYSAWSPAGS